MNEETASLLVDLFFVTAGTAASGIALARRWSMPPDQEWPAATWSELLLSAGALLVAAVGPNILVVALTPGMPEMPVLARFALLPSRRCWLPFGSRPGGAVTNG